MLCVFKESLRRLADRSPLPQGEEPINLELYWICRNVHFEQLQAKASIPFVILFDSSNQPQSDDSADSRRLKKRPDFLCALTDEQASTARSSQIVYILECKRLGRAEGSWVLNENYAEHGMRRFIQADHSYAKGCPSATMIGYMQNMQPDDVLREVNGHAKSRTIPSLTMAAKTWAIKDVTEFSNRLTRDFAVDPLTLNHLWLDLRHCTFTEQPAKSKTKRMKTGKRKATKDSKKRTAKTRSSR